MHYFNVCLFQTVLVYLFHKQNRKFVLPEASSVGQLTTISGRGKSVRNGKGLGTQPPLIFNKVKPGMQLHWALFMIATHIWSRDGRRSQGMAEYTRNAHFMKRHFIIIIIGYNQQYIVHNIS